MSYRKKKPAGCPAWIIDGVREKRRQATTNQAPEGERTNTNDQVTNYRHLTERPARENI